MAEDLVSRRRFIKDRNPDCLSVSRYVHCLRWYHRLVSLDSKTMSQPPIVHLPSVVEVSRCLTFNTQKILSKTYF